MALSGAFGWVNRASLWRRRVHVAGSKLTATSLDRLLYLWLHRCGLMGAEETCLLHRHVRPGMRVIDVGANIGLYTLQLARLAGETGQVFAFEPEPTLFRAMRNNCIANAARNVTPINLALGAHPGRVQFQRNAFNSGDNRLGGLGWGAEEVEVEVARLDDVLPEPRVDFLKMDVQGYEFEVFRGMDRVFATSPALEVFFEFWPFGLTTAGSDPNELLDYLCARGFRIFHPERARLVEVTDRSALLASLPGRKFTNLLASRTLTSSPAPV
jgi:FkbM family methyltransferase